MALVQKSKLNPKKRYLQLALNSTLQEAQTIIRSLPVNERIIVEVGTPLIKRYGEEGIRKIRSWCQARIVANNSLSKNSSQDSKFEISLKNLAKTVLAQSSLGRLALLLRRPVGNNVPKIGPSTSSNVSNNPYIVADLKTMDRGETEVDIAWRGGASAVIALGSAPIETLDAFIAHCQLRGLDPMIDMMNVEYPLKVLSALKKIPPVVIVHRGVDEEKFNKEKQIPLHEIRRIKARYDIMIAIAGGDSLREVQRAVFNDADIVVIWKSVYQHSEGTINLINNFFPKKIPGSYPGLVISFYSLV